MLALLEATALGQSIQVLERGPHEQVIQSIEPDGSTNTFTQLQTGLNRWSNQSWIPAAAIIESVNGSLVARQTQHQVGFGATANSPAGTIDLFMVNGSRFRAQPMGIAYTEFKDGQPGKSVFIAVLQQSAATLTASDQVTYFAAFDYADLAYDLS